MVLAILAIGAMIALFLAAVIYWVHCLEQYANSDEWKEHKDDKEYWDNYPWP